MLLSLNEVKQHLRYDEDDNSNDMVLTSYIMAAEAAIKKFIRSEIDIDTQPDIKIAAMLLVGFFDLYRNAEAKPIQNTDYMPYPVLYLLKQYRKPTAI